MSTVLTVVYAHASKEAMYAKGEKLGLTGEALAMFKHGLCEVEMTIEVNEDNGEVKLVGAKWGADRLGPIPSNKL